MYNIKSEFLDSLKYFTSSSVCVCAFAHMNSEDDVWMDGQIK